MPRLSEAKKDVVSCEKLRGPANRGRSAGVRMGQPAGRRPGTAQAGQTQGTETSKYLEEEKTTVIAPVVASESARAQTPLVTANGGL